MAELAAERKRALDELFAQLYDRMRQLASRVRWHGSNPTLNPTALVHETYLKLLRSPPAPDSHSYEDAIGVFANAMRQILVDASRRKSAKKRLPVLAYGSNPFSVEDALTLASLVESLREEKPRQAQIVDCRFYLGMTVEEASAALGLSTTTVEREWREAKAHLDEQLRRKEVPQ